MHRKALLPALLLIASLLLAACGGGSQPAAQNTPAAQAPTTAAAEPTTAPTTAAAEPTAATAAEPTTAPTTAAAGGAATATPAAAASSDELFPEVPADLKRFDGVAIKAVLGSDGPSTVWEDAAAAKFSELTGANVTILRGDRSATDRLATYRQQLSAQSPDVDVYMIDVIWPGIMAEYAEDLTPALGSLTGDFFPAIVQNNTVDGKLVGMPWYTDAGLLYYRTDLLQKYGYSNPPATWAELEEMAAKIQEGERATSPDFWGFVWQGKAYEGLTCDALEWQVSNGGGTIVEPDGTISINNPQAAAAFDRAKAWIGKISPEGVTTYQEEEARGVWQAGNAAFMRNWPYAYGLGNADDSPIKGKFNVSVLPKGDGANARNAATLGGWQLMVNRYSANKEAAIEFVKFLTSYEIQKSHSIKDSKLPTRPALYDDADVLAVNEFYGPLKEVFSGGAVARPSTVTADLYNDVSTAYFTAVNQILTGQKETGPALEELQGEIESILR